MKRILFTVFVIFFFLILFTKAYANEKLFETKYEALQADFRKEYWKVIFTFCPGGDSEIPYLLQYIDDENRNVRFSSILLLGKWFLSYESKDQLMNQYWREKDPEIRILLLSSLEILITNSNESREFFSSVVEEETDPKIKEFAMEALNIISELPSMIDGFEKEKEVNQKKFKSEYNILYRSYGKSGSYEKLNRYSSLANEKELKLLKIQVLKRNSDEALYDYQKINDIILENRFISAKQ